MANNIGKDAVIICQTEIEKVVSLAKSFAFYRANSNAGIFPWPELFDPSGPSGLDRHLLHLQASLRAIPWNYSKKIRIVMSG